jgi:enoyl-CoA hydratase
MTDLVTTRTEGDITIARFDDGKANALSFDMLDQLNAALDAAEASSKAVALIGREGKFSAGFDLTVMNGGDLDATRRILQIGAELALRIFMSPIPVVLGITGHALAQGGIIAACADYRVGAEGPYKLGLPEVAIGMPMPTFGAELCRDRISKKWYTRCVQHGELLTPDHARPSRPVPGHPRQPAGRAGRQRPGRPRRRPRRLRRRPLTDARLRPSGSGVEELPAVRPGPGAPGLEQDPGPEVLLCR